MTQAIQTHDHAEKVADMVTELHEKYPDLVITSDQDGRVEIHPHDLSVASLVSVEAWAFENHGHSDAWRYRFSHTTAQQESVGPFSHPTLEGCFIAARRYFIDCGAIAVPRDNSHLSDHDRTRVDVAVTQRMAQPMPATGDWVQDKHGTRRRFCNPLDGRAQTTKAVENSYHLHMDGSASYSGGLSDSVPYSELSLAYEPDFARFWIFRDGRSGAGRGVDVFAPVRVWHWSGSFEGMR